MANAYVLNQRPATYGAAISLLVEMLVAAGWVYKSSGDGLSGFSSSTKIFTGTGSGALGWGNAKAWARIQDPGGGREFIFQHDNTGSVRFKYSASAKFTGGSPSSTVTPSATDEQYVRGGASDATPTYGTWFDSGTVSSTNVYQGAALAAAPYGFWFASVVNGSVQNGGRVLSTIMMDPVTGVAEDPDPCVIHIAPTNGFYTNFYHDGLTVATDIFATTPASANGGTFGFMNVAKTYFAYVQAGAYTCNSTSATVCAPSILAGGVELLSSSLGPNPFNGKQETMPIPYFRLQIGTTQAAGLKGWSTMARWTAYAGQANAATAAISRAIFQDTTDSKAWICVGAVWLPWDGTTQPYG